MASRRIVVSGFVQGVGFRAFVLREAQRLGVRGRVWNRPDGRVEAILEHEDAETLDALIQRIEAGPGRVDFVQVSEDAEHGFSDFQITTAQGQV